MVTAVPGVAAIEDAYIFGSWAAVMQASRAVPRQT